MVPSNGSSFGNGNPLGGQWFNGTGNFNGFNGTGNFNGFNGPSNFNGFNGTGNFNGFNGPSSFNGFNGFSNLNGFNASMPFGNTSLQTLGSNGLNSTCGNPMLATAILASCTPNPAAAYAYATALSNCFSAASTLPGTAMQNWNGTTAFGTANPMLSNAFGTTLFANNAMGTSGLAFNGNNWNGNGGWNSLNNSWNGSGNGLNNSWNGNGNGLNNTNPANGWNGGNAPMNTSPATSGGSSPLAASSQGGTYGQWTGTSNRNTFAGAGCGSTANTGNAFSAASVASGNASSNWGTSVSSESTCRTPARSAA